MNQVVSLLSNLSLGMLHALEPGHGKSFFAAYMVGNRLKWKEVSMVIFGMLSAHFTFLLLLAALVSFIVKSYEGFNLHNLTLFGPIVIICFGIFLLLNELRHHNHEHAHTHTHNHDVIENKEHHNCSCEEKHDKYKKQHPIIAGLLIGFLPCPSVLAPVMLGIEKSFTELVFFILIYVLGMGLVLGCFIIALNYYSDDFNKFLSKISGKFKPEIISAILIISIGFVYLAFNLLGHHA